MKQFLDKDGLEVVRDKVNEARETAAGAIGLAQQAIDNVGFTRYSTAEQDTGNTWINGKKIYRKVIDCGNAPNATQKSVPTGISNLELLIKGDMTFYPESGTGNMMTVPFINPSALEYSFGWNIDTMTNQINITTTTNQSAKKCFVILEYTKSN